MANKGKKQRTTGSGGTGPKGMGFGIRDTFTQDLQKIVQLVGKGKQQQAFQAIVELTHNYPQQKKGWELLMAAAIERDDIQLAGKAADRLLKLRPTHPDAPYILAGAAIAGGHPFIIRQIGQQALTQNNSHSMAEELRKTLALVESNLGELLKGIDLPEAEAIDLLTQHEWGQLYLRWNNWAESKEVEEVVVARKPDFMPARNNLSLIAVMTGNLEEAIAQSQAVLTYEPENIHALSNLVRFHHYLGDLETAERLGEQLKVASPEKTWDPYTKKIEALTFLSDDAGVVAVWEQAKTVGEDQSALLEPMTLHLAAVAHARLDQIDEAKSLWQQAVKKESGFTLARENLLDLGLPVSQRQGPWPFNSLGWLSPAIHTKLWEAFSADARTQIDSPEGVKHLFDQIDAGYPGFILGLERMLFRGNNVDRQLALDFVMYGQTPTTQDLLQRFAESQAGPDRLRQKAKQRLVETGL